MSKELASAIRELREEIRKMNSGGGGGGYSNKRQRGSGGGSNLAGRAGANLKSGLSDTKNILQSGLSGNQLDPVAQTNRLLEEGMRYEDLNRRMFEAGGENIRNMYKDILANGRTIFEQVGQNSRKYFGDTEAGLSTMLKMFSGLGQMEIISNSQRESIASTTTALDQLGMPAQTTIEIIDSLNNGFGMNIEQSASMAKGVYDLAKSLQRPPRQMAEEFNRAQKDMAYSADKIGQVFTGLQKKSRITGLSYDTLMGSVGNSMDTFEGAASAAGGLNSVLGGPYLNSMELLTASEDERVQMLQDAFAESGKNVDELGKFELKALAAQLNMKPEQARRLLRGDPGREALAEKIDERMKDAGTADEIKMQSAPEGNKELRQAFNDMIPPLDKISIDLNNAAENILRQNLPPGERGGEGYRVRDEIARQINTAAEGVAVDTRLPDAMTNLANNIINAATEQIQAKVDALTGAAATPKKDAAAAKKEAEQSSNIAQPSALENLVNSFREALGGQPLSVSVNLNSKNVTDLQGVILPNPTGGKTQ